MRLPFSRQPGLAQAVEPGTCMYGGHAIPSGQLYTAVLYSRERFDGKAVDVDDCGVMLFACMRHAPSEAAVARALRVAGIPA